MALARLGRAVASRPRLHRFQVEEGSAGTSPAKKQARPRTRRLSLYAIALGITTASLGLAACGSPTASPPSTTSTPQATTSTSATAPTSPTATTAPSAEVAAVLGAYRAGWAAYLHAGATANPADPELQATMVNPLLHQVIGNLVTDNMEGIIGKGSIALHPHVKSIDGSAATVLDCAFSSSFQIYKKTGKQVPPATKPEHDAVKATLILDGSTWKVKSQQITEGSCPAGY